MLPALYRGHDALLFTSRYEAWGMPVLEGMASGLPVVATSCLGVQTFAQHGVNALLADPQVTHNCANCPAVSLYCSRCIPLIVSFMSSSEVRHVGRADCVSSKCRMCHNWLACC